MEVVASIYEGFDPAAHPVHHSPGFKVTSNPNLNPSPNPNSNPNPDLNPKVNQPWAKPDSVKGQTLRSVNKYKKIILKVKLVGSPSDDAGANVVVRDSMVTFLDESVGNITKVIKSEGVWDNTLIVFSADNGGYLGNGGDDYPRRGGKFGDFEGGTRVNSFISGGLVPHLWPPNTLSI